MNVTLLLVLVCMVCVVSCKEEENATVPYCGILDVLTNSTCDHRDIPKDGVNGLVEKLFFGPLNNWWHNHSGGEWLNDLWNKWLNTTHGGHHNFTKNFTVPPGKEEENATVPYCGIMDLFTNSTCDHRDTAKDGVNGLAERLLFGPFNNWWYNHSGGKLLNDLWKKWQNITHGGHHNFTKNFTVPPGKEEENATVPYCGIMDLFTNSTCDHRDTAKDGVNGLAERLLFGPFNNWWYNRSGGEWLKDLWKKWLNTTHGGHHNFTTNTTTTTVLPSV